MFIITGYDDTAVKSICHDCGSASAKASYSFVRRLLFVNGGKVRSKVWCKVWRKHGKPVCFYFAFRNRNSVRLIEIAVIADEQRKGLGKMMLNTLLADMKMARFDTLTFRSPIYETAIDFWVRQGTKIVGQKNNDYEMKLTIKI